MIWARKGVVHVLAFLLLVSLVGGALAVSTNDALSKPVKLEGWLHESKLYDRFVANTITQAQSTIGTSTGSDGNLLTDPALQQAAQSAFPPQLIQHSINDFIDSNYSWLQGKTSKPDFVIDLTSAKQNFAKKVGKYAETRFAALPPCTPLQLAQLVQNPNQANINALSISCRPPGISPTTAGGIITQRVANSDSFLSKPVLTAETINPRDDKGGSHPYYVKLAKAPLAYRTGQKLPLILGIMALLCTLGIVLIAPTRRRGVRRIGWVLLISGLVLTIVPLIANLAFKQAQRRVFNGTSVGPLQQSLADFARLVQHHIVKDDLYFAIVYLILALIILAYVLRTHQRVSKIKNRGLPPSDQARPAPPSSPDAQLNPRPRPAVLDVMAPRSQPSGPPQIKAQPSQPLQEPPKRPRPPGGPRLIQ